MYTELYRNKNCSIEKLTSKNMSVGLNPFTTVNVTLKYIYSMNNVTKLDSLIYLFNEETISTAILISTGYTGWSCVAVKFASIVAISSTFLILSVSFSSSMDATSFIDYNTIFMIREKMMYI